MSIERGIRMSRRAWPACGLALNAVLGASASGQTVFYWAAPGDGVWSEPTNWLPVGVPGSLDSVVIGGSEPVTVTIASEVRTRGIALANPSATLRIRSDAPRVLRLFGPISGPGRLLLAPLPTGMGISMGSGARIDAPTAIDTTDGPITFLGANFRVGEGASFELIGGATEGIGLGCLMQNETTLVDPALEERPSGAVSQSDSALIVYTSPETLRRPARSISGGTFNNASGEVMPLPVELRAIRMLGRFATSGIGLSIGLEVEFDNEVEVLGPAAVRIESASELAADMLLVPLQSSRPSVVGPTDSSAPPAIVSAGTTTRGEGDIEGNLLYRGSISVEGESASMAIGPDVRFETSTRISAAPTTELEFLTPIVRNATLAIDPDAAVTFDGSGGVLEFDNVLFELPLTVQPSVRFVFRETRGGVVSGVVPPADDNDVPTILQIDRTSGVVLDVSLQADPSDPRGAQLVLTTAEPLEMLEGSVVRGSGLLVGPVVNRGVIRADGELWLEDAAPDLTPGRPVIEGGTIEIGESGELGALEPVRLDEVSVVGPLRLTGDSHVTLDGPSVLLNGAVLDNSGSMLTIGAQASTIAPIEVTSRAAESPVRVRFEGGETGIDLRLFAVRETERTRIEGPSDGGPLVVSEGTVVSGRGVISAESVVVSGRLEPGVRFDTGPLVLESVSDDPTVLGASSVVHMTLPDLPDTVVPLRVAGPARLGGTLSVAPSVLGTPAPDAVLRVASWAGFESTFDSVVYDGVTPEGRVARVFYEPSGADFVLACRADIAQPAGVLDIFDIIEFLRRWSGQEPDADFNDDNTIDALDIMAFLDAWSGGCG